MDHLRTGAYWRGNQTHGAAFVAEPAGAVGLGERAAVAQEVIGYLLAGAPLDRQQAGGGTAEVFGVTGDMKTDYITGQQAANDFFSPRKDAEYIGTGEWRVVEKAHLHIRPLLADVARG